MAAIISLYVRRSAIKRPAVKYLARNDLAGGPSYVRHVAMHGIRETDAGAARSLEPLDRPTVC